MDGKVYAQSFAILNYIGRLTGGWGWVGRQVEIRKPLMMTQLLASLSTGLGRTVSDG